MRHRRRMHDLPSSRGFTARMLWTVAATFVLAGIGQYAFGYNQIRGTATDRSLAGYEGDAQVLMGMQEDDGDPWAAMAELLSHVSHRPGVLQAGMLDPDGTLVLGPDGRLVLDPAGHAMAEGTGDAMAEGTGDAMAEGTGDAMAEGTGHEPASDQHGGAATDHAEADLTGHLVELAAPTLAHGRSATGALPDGGVGFAVPVHLDVGTHALVVATDGTSVAEHLDTLRLTLLVGLGLSLIIGLPAFHILGGRRFAADHAANIDEALQDGLTGLGNHRSFHETIRTHLARAERLGQPLVLSLFDLDGFKLVNDTCGHRRGDEVLAAVGAILADCRSGDLPYRVGGDEFAVIMPDTTVDAARTVCGRIRDRINDGLAEVGVSVGIAEFQGDASDAEALWESADAAMYQAKRQGKNRVVTFSEVDGHDPAVTLSMAADLRAIIESAQLDVVFQPIFGLGGTDVFGYEALVRPPAIAGFAGPAEMFAIAERVNLVPELDALCRQSILDAARDLPDDVRLYLNISPAALDHELLSWNDLAIQVNAAGLTTDRVVIELTESTRLSAAAMRRAVEGMRAVGFRLALDDLGTGWAGFTSLRELRPDVAKVDRSIIMGAAEDGHTAALLVSIATYASLTGTQLIAEGVESSDILTYLRQSHGDLITGVQGFLLGYPAPLCDRRTDDTQPELSPTQTETDGATVPGRRA